MRSDAFAALCERRAARARLLAERFPPAAEALRFYGDVAELQKDPRLDRAAITALVGERGPSLLRDAASTLDASSFSAAVDSYRSGQDRDSPTSFFARVWLQRVTACSDSLPAPSTTPGSGSSCPRCGHPPQVGCQVAQGDGSAIVLSCSLCFEEWRAPRGCVACDESDATRLAYWSAPELPHLKVQACDACGAYLHLVDRVVEPASVADVDEVAALPLDVWARGQGFRKVTTNLVGM